MPIAPADCVPPHAIVQLDRRSRWSIVATETVSRLYHDPTKVEFSSFQVGELHYQSSRPLQASFEPPMNGADGRFLVPALYPEIVGRGATMREARQDWELNFDREALRLLALQDFEMTASDKLSARKIHRYFDMNELRYATPLKLRVYGRLVSVRGHKYKVRWIDGQSNWLSRNEVPASIVQFCIGQPFEAVVLRDARRWNMLKVESAFAVNALPEPTQEEADVVFNAKKSDLKVLDWD